MISLLNQSENLQNTEYYVVVIIVYIGKFIVRLNLFLEFRHEYHNRHTNTIVNYK